VLGDAPTAYLFGEQRQRRGFELLRTSREQEFRSPFGIPVAQRGGVTCELVLPGAAPVEQVLGHPLEAEHGQHGDKIGEGLVKGQLIRQPGFAVPGPQPVQDGVTDLVGDHVIGKCRVQGRPFTDTREPPEQHRVVLPGIEGVGLHTCLRNQVQLGEPSVPRDRAS
jgi:hypothetical protein